MGTALQIRTFSEAEVAGIVNEARALERCDLTRAARQEISDHLIAEGRVGVEGNPLSVVYRAATNVGVAKEYVDLALQNQRSIEELRRLERNLNSKFTSKQLQRALDPLIVQLFREALPQQLIGADITTQKSWSVFASEYGNEERADSQIKLYRREPLLRGKRTLSEWLTRRRYRNTKILELKNDYHPTFGSPEFNCTIFDPDYLEVVREVKDRFVVILRERLSIHNTKFETKLDYPLDLAI